MRSKNSRIESLERSLTRLQGSRSTRSRRGSARPPFPGEQATRGFRHRYRFRAVVEQEEPSTAVRRVAGDGFDAGRQLRSFRIDPGLGEQSGDQGGAGRVFEGGGQVPARSCSEAVAGECRGVRERAAGPAAAPRRRLAPAGTTGGTARICRHSEGLTASRSRDCHLPHGGSAAHGSVGIEPHGGERGKAFASGIRECSQRRLRSRRSAVDLPPESAVKVGARVRVRRQNSIVRSFGRIRRTVSNSDRIDRFATRSGTGGGRGGSRVERDPARTLSGDCARSQKFGMKPCGNLQLAVLSSPELHVVGCVRSQPGSAASVVDQGRSDDHARNGLMAEDQPVSSAATLVTALKYRPVTSLDAGAAAPRRLVRSLRPVLHRRSSP